MKFKIILIFIIIGITRFNVAANDTDCCALPILTVSIKKYEDFESQDFLIKKHLKYLSCSDFLADRRPFKKFN